MEEQPLVDEIQNYAQNIVDTVREPLLIFDATLRVQSANRARDACIGSPLNLQFNSPLIGDKSVLLNSSFWGPLQRPRRS
jgi:hypothetical protein